MRTKIMVLFLSIFSAVLFAAPMPSFAYDKPVMMFFGQKEFPESLSRESRTFQQTLTEITDILIQDFDFEVKDEVVAVKDTYTEGARNKAELAGIAQAAHCDIAVIFQVTPWLEDTGGFKKVRAQIFLEAFFVDKSARTIGKVDVTTEVPVTVRAPFQKPQIMDAAGESAKDVAAQAAKELGLQIKAHVGGGGGGGQAPGFMDKGGKNRSKLEESGRIYTLTFKKFETGELEDVLDSFSKVEGYVSHRQLKQTPTAAEVEYRSTADQSKLTSEFDLILKDLKIPVSTSTQGTEMTLSKIRVRQSN
ncbi:MAG: hypothetical protein HZA01_17210 [Nitrospinae bacterium]|nr:hypothetical protein [Nitrospinota bacterium]